MHTVCVNAFRSEESGGRFTLSHSQKLVWSIKLRKFSRRVKTRVISCNKWTEERERERVDPHRRTNLIKFVIRAEAID